MKRLLAVSATAVALYFLVTPLWFVGHTQALPAPTVDRVGFPTGYKDTFTPFYTFDNFQNRQIRAVWGNSIAASVPPGQTFNFSVWLDHSFRELFRARGRQRRTGPRRQRTFHTDRPDHNIRDAKGEGLRRGLQGAS